MKLRVMFDGGEREFAGATRFYTETDQYNNLCIADNYDRLLAVFADGKWISVQVVDDGDATGT